MRLTKRSIDAATFQGPSNRRDARWDDSLPGFGLRIYPSGKKVFLISYRANGRKRQMTLGRYGVLTLDQAKGLTCKHLATVAGGGDPLEDRKKAGQGKLVSNLCIEYIERHAKPHKKSWKDDEGRIQRNILPAWGNLKVKNIKRSDVAALHSKIGKQHIYAANRTLEMVSKMFELARRWGYLDDDAPNPARDIDHFKEQKRDRWVTHEELPRLAKAIDEEINPYARCALWIYLLTGMRKSELLQAKWDAVDWGRKEFRIEDTKAGRTHYVPLSEPAISLLRNIPRVEGNPYIIVGKKEGKHLVNINKAWRRARKAAGVDDVRLHDLRRTVGSWLAQAGNSLHLIGRVLDHTSPATTAVYARFGEDQVRQALEDHGKKIMGVAGKKPSAGVFDIAS